MTIIAQWKLQCILTIIFSYVLTNTEMYVKADSQCSDLTCENGGFCVTDATSGTGKCVCPPKFGGLTCAEGDVSLCIPSQGKCVHGSPCSDDQSGCDCSAATSEFERFMCENPATEYCSEGTFCTNGGTCKSNLGQAILSRIASRSALHEGCVCPPETKGLYCETLKFTSTSEQSGPKPELEIPTIYATNADNNNSGGNTTLTISLAVIGASLFILGVVFVIMGRRTQPRRREPLYQQESLSLKRIA